MRIGYQGIPGSYSEATLMDYLNLTHFTDWASLKTSSFADFQSLVQALLDGKIDKAVVPVENSTTGLITRSLDLFRHQPLRASFEYFQPVEHKLLVLKGVKLDQIKRVYSHPEALSQCQNFFLAHPDIEAQAYRDTAEAAEMVAKAADPSQAAIASQRAGQLYQLDTLVDGVNDEEGNTTRFFIMEPEAEVSLEGKSRLYLYVETLHEAGALSRLLQVFDRCQSNLEALTSRPIPGKPFSYGFFIEANVEDLPLPLEKLLDQLRSSASYVQVIGAYQRSESAQQKIRQTIERSH